MSALVLPAPAARGSLFSLVQLRAQTRPFLILLAIGLVLGRLGMAWLGLPLWVATTATLALLAYPAVLKWRDDGARWGQAIMVLSILVWLQGVHTLEHVVQYIQFHLLRWPPKESSGLISAANAEWIHFVWNWAVCATVAYLFRHGLRNWAGWLLLGWSLAHSLEHTYLMIQYVQQVQLLRAQGVSTAFAQGLPGIVGSHGWLAMNQAAVPAVGFVCRLVPSLVTAPRLDVHFGWNAVELAFMLPYAHLVMRHHLARGTGGDGPPASAPAIVVPSSS